MRGSLFGNAIDQMLLEGELLQDIANNRRVRAALLARHLYDCPRLDCRPMRVRRHTRLRAWHADRPPGFRT